MFDAGLPEWPWPVVFISVGLPRGVERWLRLPDAGSVQAAREETRAQLHGEPRHHLRPVPAVPTREAAAAALRRAGLRLPRLHQVVRRYLHLRSSNTWCIVQITKDAAGCCEWGLKAIWNCVLLTKMTWDTRLLGVSFTVCVKPLKGKFTPI